MSPFFFVISLFAFLVANGRGNEGGIKLPRDDKTRIHKDDETKTRTFVGFPVVFCLFVRGFFFASSVLIKGNGTRFLVEKKIQRQQQKKKQRRKRFLRAVRFFLKGNRYHSRWIFSFLLLRLRLSLLISEMIESADEPHCYFRGYAVYKFNDYIAHGTRQQYWEEPFTKAVMEGIQVRFTEFFFNHVIDFGSSLT